VTQLVLVRHAQPHMPGETPGSDRPLTETGRTDASALGSVLASRFQSSNVWTSPERRARETAELAFPLAAAGVRPQLSEVKKPWYASADEHAAAVEKYLSGEAVEDWEPRDAVVSRITQLKSDFGSLESVALVSHGLLITTWLHSEISLDDPFSFWSDLRFPDAWELSVDQKSFARIP
jgi:broad specificity phosphatase PhoE